MSAPRQLSGLIMRPAVRLAAPPTRTLVPHPSSLSRLARLNSTVSQSAKEKLTWPEYLKIRSQKRKWETAVTIPCTIGTFFAGLSYFASIEADPSQPIMGIDPFMFYGFCSISCAGVGYLMGPSIGAAFWRMTHRRTMNLIEVKDRLFHQHIVRNRVDPSQQSARNLVPDYYGEKIGNLSQYRQWLRDQSKFKKKALLPEE